MAAWGRTPWWRAKSMVRRAFGSASPSTATHTGCSPIRLASGRWPAPSILRVGVERASLLSMVGQGFGITLLGAASSLSPVAGVRFLPIADEPEPIVFSAVWSPFNQSAALRNLLDLADEMTR